MRETSRDRESETNILEELKQERKTETEEKIRRRKKEIEKGCNTKKGQCSRHVANAVASAFRVRLLSGSSCLGSFASKDVWPMLPELHRSCTEASKPPELPTPEMAAPELPAMTILLEKGQSCRLGC